MNLFIILFTRLIARIFSIHYEEIDDIHLYEYINQFMLKRKKFFFLLVGETEYFRKLIKLHMKIQLI